MFTFPHKYIEIKLEKENKEGKEFDLNEAIKVINMIERVVDDSDDEQLYQNLIGFGHNSFEIFGDDLEGKFFFKLKSNENSLGLGKGKFYF